MQIELLALRDHWVIVICILMVVQNMLYNQMLLIPNYKMVVKMHMIIIQIMNDN